jgi:thiamine kinase-like enzyme
LAQAQRAAAALLGVEPGSVLGLARLPGGMTNQSFSFRCGGRAYVLRLPGPGAGALVDRAAERAAYRALRGSGLADEVVAMDQAGRRVTVFYPGARVADAADDSDLAVAMGLARRLHRLGLPARPRFDLAAQVRRYERLAAGPRPAPYPDLERLSARTAELLECHRRLDVAEVFCHCDLNSDNVLILPGGGARLIDWEYAAGADPIVDVAMYCLYSFFERDRAELALRLYLGRQPTAAEFLRLHLHLAISGYLCALWAHCVGEASAGPSGYGGRTYAYALNCYPVAESLARNPPP